MRLEYIGLSELSGSLIVLEGVKGVAYDEMAEVTLNSGERRYGRVILIDGDRVVLQVFEGTRGISLENARTHFTGKPHGHGPVQGDAGPGVRRGGPAHRRPGGDLSRGPAGCERLGHQPGVPAVPPETASTPASPPSTAAPP